MNTKDKKEEQEMFDRLTEVLKYSNLTILISLIVIFLSGSLATFTIFQVEKDRILKEYFNPSGTYQYNFEIWKER